MTAEQRFERDLPELLADLLAGPAPDYRDSIVHATAALRQRPRWAIPERWLPMQAEGLIRSTAPPLPWRSLALLGLLAVALVWALIAAGSRETTLPPPFGVAGNGEVVIGVEDEWIGAVDLATGDVRRLTQGRSPQFSPDGTRLAFYDHADDDMLLLVVANADGSGRRTLGFEPPEGPMGSFLWTPDGRSIVYHHRANATLQVIDASGLLPTRELEVRGSTAPGGFRPPDGAQLLITGSAATGQGLVLVSIADGSSSLLVPMDVAPWVSSLAVSAPWAWSPDGRQLVAPESGDAEDGVARLLLLDIEAGTSRPLSDATGQVIEDAPSWSPDGERILYRRSTPDASGAWVNDGWFIQPVDGGAPLHLRAEIGVDQGQAIWSPDGRQLLVNDVNSIWALVDPETGERRTFSIDAIGAPTWQRLPEP